MADNYRSYTTFFGKGNARKGLSDFWPRDKNGYLMLRTGSLRIEGSLIGYEWLLLDRSNGNPENGHGYVWLFNTREEARWHKKFQNGNPNSARLIGPWRVRDCSSDFLKRERLKA